MNAVTMSDDLLKGGMYRISYLVGEGSHSHTMRSVVRYEGQKISKRWDGSDAVCLLFRLPQGRTLSLVSTQLREIRSTEKNTQGQWILTENRHRQGMMQGYGGLRSGLPA